jgi:hypothetical protein
MTKRQDPGVLSRKCVGIREPMSRPGRDSVVFARLCPTTSVEYRRGYAPSSRLVGWAPFDMAPFDSAQGRQDRPRRPRCDNLFPGQDTSLALALGRPRPLRSMVMG